MKETIQILVFAALLGLAVGVSQHLQETPKEPQLYTVHFDGIDYQDLSKGWPGNVSQVYRTKSGKRIEFRGNFYEVEQ